MSQITLKLSKEIIKSILEKHDIKLASKIIFHIHLSTKEYVCDEFEYKSLTTSYIRNIINPNSTTIKEYLKTISDYFYVETVTNPYNSKQKSHLYTLKEDYQVYGFYDITIEKHPKIYKEIIKMKKRFNTQSTRFINDGLICIDDVELIENNELRNLMIERKNGNHLLSYTAKTINGNGRLNSPYTNLKKSIRNQLYTSNNNKTLSEIDMKNSQFRFFLGFLNKFTNKTETMSKEIEILNNQKDIYSFFSDLCELDRNVIKKLILIMLCGNWTTHKNKQHFNQETIDAFDGDIEFLKTSWNKLFNMFDDNFKDITKLCTFLCSKDKRTIYQTIQKDESKFISNISIILKKSNIQFFTVFDAIFFDTDYVDFVSEQFNININRMSEKGYNLKYELNVGSDIVRYSDVEDSFHSSSSQSSDICNGKIIESRKSQLLIREEEEREGKGEIPVRRTSIPFPVTNLNEERGQKPKKRKSKIKSHRNGWKISINNKYHYSKVKENETKEQFRERMFVEYNLSKEDIE